ncbi:MAG: hypothetical protein ABI348_11080 [Nitrososphaera sp.]
MPPCNKECKVKVYEARNIKVTTAPLLKGTGPNCQNLTKDDKLVAFVKKTVESKTTLIEGHLCAEECMCDPVGTPKWGNWRKYKYKYKFKMTVVVKVKNDDTCKYPIEGTY